MTYDRASLPDDFSLGDAWPKPYTEGYDALAARFRPIFSRIQEGSVRREVERQLPHQEIRQLQDAGFTALRVPKEAGVDSTGRRNMVHFM